MSPPPGKKSRQDKEPNPEPEEASGEKEAPTNRKDEREEGRREGIQECKPNTLVMERVMRLQEKIQEGNRVTR